MSFILDALKKSETDRQRQGGPALFEVKVAPPRRALPAWAAAVAVLFVANLAVVGWLLLRHPARPEAAAATPAPPRAEAAAPLPSASVAMAPAAPTPTAPPPPAEPPASPAAHTLITAPTEAPPAAPAHETSSNPDDYAPAAEPPPSGSLGKVKRGTDAGVPLYSQVAATPGNQLPQLRLDLHAYAEHANERWVLINMHKLREGDSLEGVHVEHITPDGAVLSYQGTQFLLTRE